MKKSIAIIVSLAFVIGACSSKKKVAVAEKSAPTICEELILLEQPADSLPMDHYEIDSVEIINNCLEISVNYGGGCGDTEFKLYYTNRVMESMPPKTVLYLAFKDNDPCRSIVQKKLRFNLDPFKRFADRGGIYFKLDGKEKSVLYQIPK